MLTKPKDIFTIFHALSDPRQRAKVEHRLDEMIFMALCGAVCGIDTWTDLEEFVRVKIEWFRKYLRLENGVPSHDTFGRVFALLDSERSVTRRAVHRTLTLQCIFGLNPTCELCDWNI